MADFLSFALPFVFVFAVVYGVLQMSNVLKDKRMNGLIAVVLAFFAISTEWLVAMLMQLLPIAVVLFAVIFLLSFLFKPFKAEKGEKKDFTLIMVVVVLGLVFLMGQGYGMLNDILPMLNLSIDATNFMYLAGLILVLMLLYAAYSMKGKKDIEL